MTLQRAARASLMISTAIILLAVGAAALVADREGAEPSPEAEPTEEEQVADDESALEPGPPRVLVAEIDSIIQPVVAGYIQEVIFDADARGADALVLQLNTPGGLQESTFQIVRSVLASRTPVVIYVAPAGAKAASAGFYMLMAADVAVMAPGTNTGAATPVQGGGEDIEGVLGQKVAQDAAATLRSLAQRHGRDVDLAEEAVVESRSFTAQEALAGGLIDLMADDLDELIEQLHDFEPRGGKVERLRTAGAEIERLEMSGWRRLLSTLAHPTIAYLLISLGGLGLYFEFANPGAIFPGVLGALFLIMGFFALSVLPVNYAGVALIALALVLFFLELQVMSYGLLTLGGVVSLILGSLMLFRSPDPAMRLGIGVVIATVLLVVVTVALVSYVLVRDRQSAVSTGVEGMVGKRGIVQVAVNPKGKVYLHGEIWNAIADGPVATGEEIEVVAVDGMTLRVRPVRTESLSSEGG